MEKVIGAVEKHIISEYDKKQIYEAIACAFWDSDADTLDECMGVSKAYDEVLHEIGYIDDDDLDE